LLLEPIMPTNHSMTSPSAPSTRRRRGLAALVLAVAATSAAGCTIALPMATTVQANESNRHARREGKEPSRSVLRSFAGGFLVGAAIDSLLVLGAMRQPFHYPD
jgi:hypothetical protein